MPNLQLAENLRFLRKKNGLNQDDLKDILNVSRQAYSNYERCERMPDLDTLVRIASFYKVSLDDLVLRNLRTLPLETGIVRESVTAYTPGKCEETGSSIYLTREELDILARLRSQSDETRQIITGFLNQADQN